MQLPPEIPFDDLGALRTPPVLHPKDLVWLERDLNKNEESGIKRSSSAPSCVFRDVCVPGVSVISQTQPVTPTKKSEQAARASEFFGKSDGSETAQNPLARISRSIDTKGLALVKKVDLHRVGLEESFINIKGFELFPEGDKSGKNLKLTEDLGLLNFGKSSNVLPYILFERLKQNQQLTALNEDLMISLKRLTSRRIDESRAEIYAKAVCDKVKRDKKNMCLLFSGDTRKSLDDYVSLLRHFALQFQIPGLESREYEVMFQHMKVLLEAFSCSRDQDESQTQVGWTTTLALSQSYPAWEEFAKIRSDKFKLLESYENWSKKKSKLVCTGMQLNCWTIDGSALIGMCSSQFLINRFESRVEPDLKTFGGADAKVPQLLSSWFTTCRVAGRQGLANKFLPSAGLSAEDSVRFPEVTPSTIGKMVRRMGLSFFLIESISQYLPFDSFEVNEGLSKAGAKKNPLHYFQRVLQSLKYFRVPEEVQTTILKLAIACLLLGAAQRMIAESEFEESTASLGPEFEIGLEDSGATALTNPKFDQLVAESLRLYGIKEEAIKWAVIELGHQNLFILSKLMIVYYRLIVVLIRDSLNSILQNFGAFVREKKQQASLKKKEREPQMKPLGNIFSADPVKSLVLEFILLPGPAKPLRVQYKEDSEVSIKICDLKVLHSLYVQSRFARILEVFFIEKDKELYAYENVPGLLVAEDSVTYSKLESDLFRETGGLLDALADNVLDILRDPTVTSCDSSMSQQRKMTMFVNNWFLRSNILCSDLMRICSSGGSSASLRAASHAILTPWHGSPLLDRVIQELSNRLEVGMQFPEPIFLMDSELRRLVLDPRVIARDLVAFDAFPIRPKQINPSRPVVKKEPVPKEMAKEEAPPKLLSEAEQLAADIKSIEFGPNESSQVMPPTKLLSPRKRITLSSSSSSELLSVRKPVPKHTKPRIPLLDKKIKPRISLPRTASSGLTASGYPTAPSGFEGPATPTTPKTPKTPRTPITPKTPKTTKLPLKKALKMPTKDPPVKTKKPPPPKGNLASKTPKLKPDMDAVERKKGSKESRSPADIEIFKKENSAPKKFSKSPKYGMVPPSPNSPVSSSPLSSDATSSLSESSPLSASVSSTPSSSPLSSSSDQAKAIVARQENVAPKPSNVPFLNAKGELELGAKAGEKIPKPLIPETKGVAKPAPTKPPEAKGGKVQGINKLNLKMKDKFPLTSPRWQLPKGAETRTGGDEMCLPLLAMDITTDQRIKKCLTEPLIQTYIDTSQSPLDGSLGQERWHPFFIKLREVDQLAAQVVSRLPKFLSNKESGWTFKCFYSIILERDDYTELTDKLNHCNLPTLLYVAQNGYAIRVGYESFCQMFYPLIPKGILRKPVNRKLNEILGEKISEAAEYQKIIRETDSHKLGTYQAHAWRIISNVLGIPPDEYLMGRNLLFFKRRTWYMLEALRAKFIMSCDVSFINKAKGAINCLILRRRFLRCLHLVTRIQALWRSAILVRRLRYNAYHYIPLLCGAILCSKLISPYKNVGDVLNLMRREKMQKVTTLFNFRTKAATRIQAWWRGVLAQKELRKRKEKKVFVAGAEFLQAAVRMYNARMDLLEKAKSRTRIHIDTGLDLNNPKVLQATRVIQTYWRARRGKAVTKFKALRDGLQKMIIPIKNFSRHARVMEAMGLKQALRINAGKDPGLQKFVNLEAKRRLEKGNKAAIKIQAVWRGWFMYRQWVDFQKAVWIVQTFLHTQLMRVRLLFRSFKTRGSLAADL
eukprot:Gregarina_sp_Poly_1__5680@NODE_299_length_9812_cov_19_573320_g258_i0_p1_GENE_NODE_299_length_9812_cov_19_573320_g258_i0NODE_299_length_9812_cov_19_573320_g258_i0_p1_ORF_typecomplete_len1749_score248_72IQ/PF00612_27/25IQ/PF00612_27/1_2e05IQ/PF00612_27/16IQ/PF00612_27/2_6e02IQ/PF00612_27/0_00055Myosin_head/PF00063_21/99Myosin_head/PF00063_21/3_1Myosin_head/PF00063_21/13_NODE_299_length_9812_cov_19_573320_g258_i0895335